MSGEGQTGLSGSAQAEAARERMQEKSFRTWMNMHLAKHKMAITDITTDFADGIRLIKLVETISEETLGKYHKNPVSKIQKVENLNLPIKYINSFVASVGIRNEYSAENILDEDKAFILGMIWTLILRFSINEISEGEMTAKEGLLLWAKKKVKEGSNGTVEITNFHTSWQNGMAFNALINAFRPDLLDAACGGFSTLNKDKKLENLNQAFDLADSKLNIPKILDAEDMVSMRPDEKSVMTYVSMFWKEFAANKRKNLAGERIADVVRREQALEDMSAQYVTAAEELARWVQGKIEQFSKEPEANSSEEAESELLSFLQYGRTDKPKKHGDMLELQALASSIETRLSALGRQFNPPEHVSLPKMQKWWEELTEKEIQYEDKLKAKMKSLKRVELLIKLFNSKATKLEDWMATKSAWLQVRHKILRVSVVDGEMAPRLSRAASGSSVLGPSLSQRASDENIAPSGTKSKSVSISEDAKPESRNKSTSILDNVTSFFRQGSKKMDKDLVADGADSGLAETSKAKNAPTPAVTFMADEVNALKSDAPKSKSMRGGSGFVRATSMTAQEQQDKLIAEAERTAESPDGGLDSASKVQAKLNMFAAYEDELKGRETTIDKLTELVEKAVEAGCPPFRQFSLQNRVVNIKEQMDGLKEAGAEYKEGLEVELQRQLRLEEMRVNFAKQAEALNRWVEESMDVLTEVLQADSVAAAQTEMETLKTFELELTTKQKDALELAEFAQNMRDEGIVSNPYCRFSLTQLQESMRELEEAAASRKERLEAALGQQQEFDAKKKAFAEQAGDIAAKVAGEKEQVDGISKSVGSIPQDDPAAIARGKEGLAQLEEMGSLANRERRAALLAPAQEINDWLVEAGELDNPYTRETVASLKTQVEVLETLLRDKQSFIEAQITRAQADISPEQYAEIKTNFKHFDTHTDGFLNKDEFGAVLKSLDLELTPEEEEKTFAKFAKDEGGKTGINLESFTTFMLQQLKAKDTVDALLDAFATVAGGRDYITAEDLHSALPPEEAKFLLSRMDGLDLGLDYKTFANKVFGIMRNS
jgi:actinin alpha